MRQWLVRGFQSFAILMLLAVLVSIHAAAGWVLHKQRPKLDILPPVPSQNAVAAMGFGDKQFLYRSLVLQIQNAGDTGGRFTPMRQYDPTQVVQWLNVLQSLDSQSSHYSALAVRYFALSGEEQAIRLLVEFINKDVDLAPALKWYWQTQAVELARTRLKDVRYALSLSRKLIQFAEFVPSGYAWVLQLEPVLLAELNQQIEARAAINRVNAIYGHKMTPEERNWTRSFMESLPD